MFATLTLAAALSSLQPAVLDDLKCLAVFAAFGSDDDAPDAETENGMVGGTMFYFGRLDARAPDLDLQGQFEALFADDGFAATIPDELRRCGAELEVRAAKLGTVEDSAAPPSDPQEAPAD